MHGTIDTLEWQRHAWRNRLQSAFLLAVMAGFLALLGWLLWGAAGLVVLLVLGVVAGLFNPAITPRMVMGLYGAAPIHPRQAPTLWSTVSRLAERAGLPEVPALYYLPSPMLNAFAVGSPQRSAIAVTDGLLRQLELRELAGVLAHEMSHVRNGDLWVMGLADLFSRATAVLSLVGQLLVLLNLPLMLWGEVVINWWAVALLVFAPSLAALAQLALSRTREYDADLNAVRLTGDPEGLARALGRIERVQGGLFERIFMPGRRIPDPSLLRTHPDTEDRIERLMSVKRDLGITKPWPRGRTVFDHNPFVHGLVERSPRWRISGLWH